MFCAFSLFSVVAGGDLSLSPLSCVGEEEEEEEEKKKKKKKREVVVGSRKKGNKSKISLFILSFSCC